MQIYQQNEGESDSVGSELRDAFSTDDPSTVNELVKEFSNMKVNNISTVTPEMEGGVQHKSLRTHTRRVHGCMSACACTII